MDKLSKIRRYLVANQDVLVLSEPGLDYAIHTVFVRRNRERMAELLCAAISDALGCPFGLGPGRDWFAQGGELMNEMLESFLNATIFTGEERERGRAAVRRPHTAASLLELLAATDAAITKRANAETQARQQQRPALQVAA